VCPYPFHLVIGARPARPAHPEHRKPSRFTDAGVFRVSIYVLPSAIVAVLVDSSSRLDAQVALDGENGGDATLKFWSRAELSLGICVIITFSFTSGFALPTRPRHSFARERPALSVNVKLA
jgi:hypothetical protein